MEDTRELVRAIYKITAALKKLHPHRNFTPDGILGGVMAGSGFDNLLLKQFTYFKIYDRKQRTKL